MPGFPWFTRWQRTPFREHVLRYHGFKPRRSIRFQGKFAAPQPDDESTGFFLLHLNDDEMRLLGGKRSIDLCFADDFQGITFSKSVMPIDFDASFKTEDIGLAPLIEFKRHALTFFRQFRYIGINILTNVKRRLIFIFRAGNDPQQFIFSVFR